MNVAALSHIESDANRGMQLYNLSSKLNAKFDWDAAVVAASVIDHWLNQFFISNVVKCEII